MGGDALFGALGGIVAETPVEERARLLAEGDAAWAELCGALDRASPDAVLPRVHPRT